MNTKRHTLPLATLLFAVVLLPPTLIVAQTLEQTWSYPGMNVLSVALDSTGQRLFSLQASSSSRWLRTLDTATGEIVEERELPDSIANPDRIVYNSGNDSVYIEQDGGAQLLPVVNLSDPASIWQMIPVGFTFFAVAADPSANRIYLSGSEALAVIDAASAPVTVTKVPVAGLGGPIAVDKVRDRAYVRTFLPSGQDPWGYFIAVLDGSSAEIVEWIPLPYTAWENGPLRHYTEYVAFSNRSNRLYTYSWLGDEIRGWRELFVIDPSVIDPTSPEFTTCELSHLLRVLGVHEKSDTVIVGSYAFSLSPYGIPIYGAPWLELFDGTTLAPKSSLVVDQTIRDFAVDEDRYLFYTANGANGTVYRVSLPNRPNAKPVANDQSLEIYEDETKQITLTASDEDGDELTYEVTALPTHGSLAQESPGVYSYTPVTDFFGADSFQFTAYDGTDTSDAATVTIEVSPVNDAPVAIDDQTQTSRRNPVTIYVLANDSDVDGDALTITSVSTPANGTAVISSGGTSITYTPATTITAPDVFSYTISDGHGGTATAQTTVSPSGASGNQLPVANPDVYPATAGVATPMDVLANDTDPDGDTPSLIAVSNPTAIGASVVIDGSQVIYTAPSAASSSKDSFQYTITDGFGGSATATVNVDLSAANQPPLLSPDIASAVGAVAITIDVLKNDRDPDNDALTVISVISPTALGATVTITPEGKSVVYTAPRFTSGTDSFDYQVSDGRGGTAWANVSVTVGPGNINPVALNDTAGALAGVLRNIEVLLNDSDSDGDPLTITAVGASSIGAEIVVASDGKSITYYAATASSKPDQFTYTISDGYGGTATATVTVSIDTNNLSPQAADDSVAAVFGVESVIDVLQNDTDPDRDPLLILDVTLPTSGSLRLADDRRTILYTATDPKVYTDRFSYTVSDGKGGEATASVLVAIPNRAPTAKKVDAAAKVGEPSVSINLGAAVSDPDPFDHLTIEAVTQPASGYGSVEVSSSELTVTYTPPQDFPGTGKKVSFSLDYTVSDGRDGTDTSTISITLSR
ncbi:MAG: Ig-like domain-containing protein [Verrucomicrobiia bacterium]